MLRRRPLPGVLLLALLALTGCGIKGPLRPMGSAEPAAVAGLALAQQGEELLLSWQAPTANQDGTPLTDLAGFAIHRLSYLPENYCDECRDPDEPLLRIDPAYPDPATRSGDRYLWRDRHVAVGIGYRYLVVPVRSDGSRGADSRVRQVVQTPPPPPSGFSAEPLDRGARLAWQLPAELPAGMELLGVQIYRAAGDQPLQALPGGAKTGTAFDDFGLVNDQPYRYGLRSVVRTGELVLESGLGTLVEVTPDADR